MIANSPGNSGAVANADHSIGECGQTPFLVIKPQTAPLGLDVVELWRFRDLVWQLALRDLRLRYKQTVLGAVWVVMQPLLAAAIFTFVFGVLAKLPSDGKPAFLISFVGLLGWNLFSGSLSRLSTCLTGNSALISKVYFPRLVLPISTIPSVLVDFLVALGMGIVLMAIYGVSPTLGVLVFPLCTAMLITTALGIGLLSASLSVNYRDINYVLPVALQMLLYASPVGYDISAVPMEWRTLYSINPLVGAIEAFRWGLLGGTPPGFVAITVTIVFSMAFAIIGLRSFKMMERKFADVV